MDRRGEILLMTTKDVPAFNVARCALLAKSYLYSLTTEITEVTDTAISQNVRLVGCVYTVWLQWLCTVKNVRSVCCSTTDL